MNHILPSGPTVIPTRLTAPLGILYSVMVSVLGKILPILFPSCSSNHRFPSGPVVIPQGYAFAVGTAYSVTLSVFGKILPI